MLEYIIVGLLVVASLMILLKSIIHTLNEKSECKCNSSCKTCHGERKGL
ncbi:MAG: FeoB-associated Cys-rich membrane protein [Candidatus Eremiobacterota bacterium]